MISGPVHGAGAARARTRSAEPRPDGRHRSEEGGAKGTIRADFADQHRRQRGARFGRARDRAPPRSPIFFPDGSDSLIRADDHAATEPARPRLRSDSTASSPASARSRSARARCCVGSTSRGPADFDGDDRPRARTLRAKLAERRRDRAVRGRRATRRRDGTRKWLLRAVGRPRTAIETVFIPEDGPRHAVHLASQVGCALDCAFCSTGGRASTATSSAAEIVGQLWLANQRARLGAGRRAGRQQRGADGHGRAAARTCDAVAAGAAPDARRQRLRPVAAARDGVDLRASCRAWIGWPRNARSRSRCRCTRRTTRCATSSCRSTASTRSRELMAACKRCLERGAARLHHRSNT
jgi:hypothetical protein